MNQHADFSPCSRYFHKRLSSLSFLLVLGIAATGSLQNRALAQTQWKAISGVPVDPQMESLFEVTAPLDAFDGTKSKFTPLSGGQQAKASISRDTTVTHSGNASLRIDYTFAADKELEYVQLASTQCPFTNANQAFGFWYKNPGTSLPMKLRILDASGECHQLSFLATQSKDWQFAVCRLDSESSAWGGDGNKKKDFPCRFESLCFDRPKEGFKGSGSFWIESLAWLKPTVPISRKLELTTANWRFGNLFTIGETISLKALGKGDHIRWRWMDYLGRELEQGESDGSTADIKFTLKQSGWFSCRIELLDQKQVVGSETFSCAALPANNTAHSDFFGVCTHYGQNAYPLETMELLKQYGIDQFRDEISWDSYEPEKGKLGMPAYGARFLKKAADLKMKPLLIYDYANSHYDKGAFPNSPETIEAFTRYATALTRDTHGQVAMFEVWNEWIGGCGMDGRPGKHDSEAYGRLLKPVYASVKKAYPVTTIVGIGGEYGRDCASNIVNTIRTAGTHSMNAWSIHPYRYPNRPEDSDLVGEVHRIRQAVANTGEPGKAWITEIGYPTHRGNNGVDEATQARYLVRTLALMQASHSVEKLFWYDFKDDGLNREYNENNFGLIHHETYNCAPKSGIVAAAVYIRLTENASFTQLKQDKGMYMATAKKQNGDEVHLLWFAEGHGSIPLSNASQKAYDLMGNPIATTNGVVSIDENPVYLIQSNP